MPVRLAKERVRFVVRFSLYLKGLVIMMSVRVEVTDRSGPKAA